MKKIITLGILILFVLSCFLPLVTGSILEKQNHVSRDVIIVDDEGDGDYTSIKDALNHADPGDTIEVYSGTYYEHTIVIETENITLEGISHELGNGSDTGKPFIDGPGTDPYDLIAVKADGVTINGFHIENYHGGGTGNVCIGIYHNANKCVISNNDIAHTLSSLIWIFGSDNKILNNNISYSVMRQGIVLRDPCSNCIVSGNVISDVETGILFWDSNHNTATGNKISRCSEFGIDIAGGEYNTVEGNTFENNTVGVQIYYSLGSRIKNNNFINNQWQAQFEYGIPLFIGLTNRWNGNYWGRPRLLPYPIIGTLIFFPWVQFDWHPVLEAYDIPGGDLSIGNQEEQTNMYSQQNSQTIIKTKSSTGSICVTVKHAEYKTPLNGACVVAYNLETKDWYYVLPDEDEIGVYINNNLPVGGYFIGAGKEGYTIDGATVTIKAGQQVTLTFCLRPESPDDYSNKEQGAISEETIVNQQNSNSQSSSQQSMRPLFLQIIGRLLNLR